jgi:heme A synthase
MNDQELVNRGNNLTAVTVLAAAGFAFLPEIFAEDELVHKIDDILLLVLGIIAWRWYRVGNNRFVKSIVPVILVVVAVIVKVAAVILEMKDKADVGDDFGGLLLLAVTAIVVWRLARSRVRLS